MPVLLYHRFEAHGASTPWTVKTGRFEAQVRWLLANGYTISALRSGLSDHPVAAPVAAPALAITVDDGDRSVYTEMFPLIVRYRIPVTLFIYPYAISLSPSALTWDHLREMVESGFVDVQFHTLSHPDFSYERGRRNPGDFRAFVSFELNHWRDKVEQQLGTCVDMLAWPFGIYDDELLAEAERSGYLAAFAVKLKSARDYGRFSRPRLSISNRDEGKSLGERIRSSVASMP
jgi:hypothetical protein